MNIKDVNFKEVSWWVLLATAVLVVPCIAYLITTLAHVTGGSEVLIFVISCWACVFFGLRLMKAPRINSIMFENIIITEPTKLRFISMIAMVESEITKWKKRYDKSEAIFMSLSKQPAWSYIDEVVVILTCIKHSVTKDASISFTDIKALTEWVESAKSSVIEQYLHSLEASYGYAKAEYAQQGKSIDETYPELSNGNSINSFIKAPLFATTYAREMMKTLEKEYPLIGRFSAVKPISKAA